MVPCLVDILLLLQCLCGMAGEVLTCSVMAHMVYMNNKISITDVEPFGVGKMV